MDFVRKIINSDDLDAVLNLPQELKHKQVEVLVLPVEEEKDIEKFNPEEFRGVLNIENVEEEVKAIREEWDRT